jgi:Domain of unknown function (DUF1937)
VGVTLSDLTQYSLVYMASPYELYPTGKVPAFRDACTVAARIIGHGVHIFSPISHSHSIQVHGDFEDDFDWLLFDEAMMNVSDALLVAKLLSWEVSAGIRYEINFFRKANKPIFLINPHNMEISKATDELAS